MTRLSRWVLVPARVSLFGELNWWLPEPARLLLRLPTHPRRSPSPAEELQRGLPLFAGVARRGTVDDRATERVGA